MNRSEGGKLMLRPSEINTYIQCSAKFRFQVIDKEPQVKSLALAFGSAIHRGLETNYKQKVETRADLEVEEVVSVFSDAFDEEKEDVPPTQLIEDPTAKDTGVNLIRTYQRTLAPLIQPKLVEQKVEATFTGYDVGVTGTLDLLTVQRHIRDHKTAARQESSPPESHIRQGSFYQLLAKAVGEVVEEVMFDYLVKTKTPKVYSATLPTDPHYALNVAQSVGTGVVAGVFVPNRDSFLCTRRFCSFWDKCEKSYGGRVRE